ncbi:fibulin-1-like [Biomphalaria glabrata]|uniref:Fibulin-1-like n=1 Tax=Biomphalaria glabrata TaxID=6526 RepID=A0A9U8E1Z4_BIOGL|nr:fibulin-1-like [Biomphalaria glabrata]
MLIKLFLLSILNVYAAKGQFYHIFDQCCQEGVQWSSANARCDGYPGPVANISTSDQTVCLSILEICCIKQTQHSACDDGRLTALDNQICAIRDSDPGAESFRECCHCCNLGLIARSVNPPCVSPGLGEPCDTMYRECCVGETKQNITGLTIMDLVASKKDGLENNEGNNDPTLAEMPSEVENADIDECAVPHNVCSHICINTKTSFVCSCPTGYQLDQNNNRTCKLIETTNQNAMGNCELNNPCEQRCMDNENGSIECKCYDGYRLALNKISCRDIDECIEKLASCATGEMCINTRGGYTCSPQCPASFILDSKTGVCKQAEDPQCQPGYIFSVETKKCEDLNECGLSIDSCEMGERCENTIGSYVCRRERNCGTGYTLDEKTQKCYDNDECALGTHNCLKGYNCLNLQGTFRCNPKPCPPGQKFDRKKADCVDVVCPEGLKPNEVGNCVDIDECKLEGASYCKRHQKCINTKGSYYCRNYVNCPPGYEPTETTGCQDIDECEQGIHKCTNEQQCVNKQGTYFCQCPRGFKHDVPGRCTDVDECFYFPSICSTTSKCVNTIGSYKCECIEGLVSADNDTCTDVDECQYHGICQHSCVNVVGTYFCSCNKGYQLQDDKKSCEDIDECTQFPSRNGGGGVCTGHCINVPGSYKCDCPNGFRLKPDSRQCEDINECTEQSAQCPAGDSVCFNIRGGFKCPLVRCPDGFVRINSSGQNSIRCKRISLDCPECRKGLISRTYNFLSFASTVTVPAPLFSMTGSRLIDKFYTWSMELVSSRALKPGVVPAQLDNFSLEKSRDYSRVTLVKRIEGPQDVVLKLSMNVSSYFKGYEGVAESRIYLYITDQELIF